MPVAGWGQPLAKIKIYMNPGENLLAKTETIVLEIWIGWGKMIRTNKYKASLE